MVSDVQNIIPILFIEELVPLPLNMVAHLLPELAKVATQRILKFNTKVIGLDRDSDSKIAEKIKNNFNERFVFKNKNLVNWGSKFKALNIRGIIFDLGLYTPKLKIQKRTIV